MNIVEPIRDPGKILKIKKLLKQRSTRDYFLFVFGINTGLRISDILKLKVSDVRGRSHLVIREDKTDSNLRLKFNDYLLEEIDEYTKGMEDKEYLFPSKTDKSISRVRAYQILNGVAKEVGLTEIGTHTLRKTFGYHFYQRTKDIAILQELFNHKNANDTLRYIGIHQDMLDKYMDNFHL
ncbi:tyrosine-type recombinase/integrase [Brevibacillus nitrificans]|uniref:tyrosine-type recombinase/integrase n=1 Tax=Brevibacillus nitrificans TaxID=651560 RepID=UPI00285D1E7B|nr:tyrosine-type recombinase/integrase [Brevibacillus nitrificans]MDR7319043.1 integrase [Brevibacillus nitrificans]